jgi:hypothetical protein
MLTRDITSFENLSTMENSSYNIADQRSNLDIFTKALAQDQFKFLREALRIVNIYVINSRN